MLFRHFPRLVSAALVFAALAEAQADVAPSAEEAHRRGRAYLEGDGVPKSTSEAIAWLSMAAEKGDPLAAFELGKIYSSNRGVPEDQVAASYWYAISATPEAAYEMAKRHLKGIGVPQDGAKANAYLLKAAEGGVAEACQELAVRYDYGRDMPVDKKAAAKWYRAAAEKGLAEAQFSYACMLESGVGGPQNHREAVRWLREAAMQDHQKAQHNLAVHYMSGVGVPRDAVQALAWFTIASTSVRLESVEARDAAEKQLGSAAVLKAQEMARELHREILIGSTVAAAPDEAPLPGPEYADAPKAQGTGAIVTRNGLILTAHHVINGAKHVLVFIGDRSYPATIEREDPANDLAALRIPADNLPAIPLAPDTDVRLGAPVATLGFPNPSVQGNALKVTRGEISALTGALDEVRDWQISAPIQSGNSGGPLLDEHGRLLGVIVTKLIGPVGDDMPQNVGYARKGAYVRAFLEPYLDEMRAGDGVGPAPSFPDMVEQASRSVVWVRIY